MSDFVLNIYNTTTGKYEDVPVSKEVYNAYRRSVWREKKQDEQYHKKAIPMSSLTYTDSNGDETIANFLCSNEPSLEEQFEDAVLRDAVHCALMMLSEVYRRRFCLRYIDGLTIPDIAATEGVSISSIKMSLSSAREKLQELLKNFKNDLSV